MPEPDFHVPISALNQYAYCPRRCWYMHVAHEFRENVHTVEGSLLHDRADSGEVTSRGSVRQFRSVTLHSERYGLTGRADVVEERAGEIVPVEFKKGPRGDWGNDQIQLCAQGLALEDMLNVLVQRGYLFYARTGRRLEVPLTPDLREETLGVIAAVRRLIRDGARPAAEYGPRCRGCSLYPICLPREVARINRILRANPDASAGRQAEK
jgi:CRISPR-associated exonuclease Cas4